MDGGEGRTRIAASVPGAPALRVPRRAASRDNTPRATKVLAAGPPFLREVRRSGDGEAGAFPFTVPAIRTLETLALPGPVTFFVGENGSGELTLLEAIAAPGRPPAGGRARPGPRPPPRGPPPPRRRAPTPLV